MLALEDPSWADLRDARGSAAGTPDLLRELQARPAARPVWREIEATLCPGGTTWSAGAAAVPHVVGDASLRRRIERLQHIAFVGHVAFGSRDLGEDLDPRFAQTAYDAATETAKRIATDVRLAQTWEPWEAEYLFLACARLAGRLRRICAGGPLDGAVRVA